MYTKLIAVKLTNLEKLTIHNNHLTNISDKFNDLINLRTIYLDETIYNYIKYNYMLPNINKFIVRKCEFQEIQN